MPSLMGVPVAFVGLSGTHLASVPRFAHARRSVTGHDADTNVVVVPDVALSEDGSLHDVTTTSTSAATVHLIARLFTFLLSAGRGTVR
jgi:hypothetical protein